MSRVAINGLGRIGRLVLRQLVKVPGVEVVAVNDQTDAATLAHLLTYDSTHGRADFPVEAEAGSLLLEGRHVKVYAESDPADLPFGEDGAEVVLECTGRFTRRDQAARHLRNGVGHVILSAPSGDADRTIVMGVNDADLDPARDRVLSNASCTTHCLAPIAMVLDETFGLERGLLTAVHSYTSDQRILDLPHPDLRRARAAAASMIPTSSGAVEAIGQVLPRLEGRLEGLSVRVPTPDVSLIDLTAILHQEAPVEAVHAAFHRAASTGPLAPYLDVLEAELVSADLVGRTASAIYDPFLTKCLGPHMVKVFAWYDNEIAYAARLKDLCLRVLEDR